MKRWRFVAVAAVVALGACGGGEDRPGQVTEEDGGGGSGSGSGSGSGAGGEHQEHGEDSAPAFPAAEATTRAEVTLRDYAFLGLPATMKGPNVLFDATVSGSNEHELEVVDGAGKTVGEIHAFKAGAKKSLAVVLQPGDYTVQCLVKEGSKTHAELGMKVPLTVE